uniref:Uncharacterized protein n=1 Tax=Physcomitrium patens TaxID=3218 RepID=A0A2K1IC96_PHYPA|nr:hypothetical protein PHYPA_030367 [Physcomitrium patens]
MKLSLSISNQILQLNDSELWKNIFDEIEDESGKDRDVEIDASSSMAVFDERFGLGRNRCLKSRKPRSGINTIRDLKLARIGLRIATDCSHGLGCDKILSTYLGENVKGMERSRDGAGLVYPYQLDIFGEIWTLIAGGVMAILGLALDYYSILRALCDGVAAPNVLSFKRKVGIFPHMIDLVTRINCNYHHITIDGRMLTPIPGGQGQMSRRASDRMRKFVRTSSNALPESKCGPPCATHATCSLSLEQAKPQVSFICSSGSKQCCTIAAQMLLICSSSP